MDLKSQRRAAGLGVTAILTILPLAAASIRADSSGSAATLGKWSAPFDLHVIGTHSTLLHDGKVLFFSSGIQSEWNNLTVTNAVLMFDRIFRELLQQTLPSANEDPVEQIRMPVEPTDRLNRFTLTRPGETRIDVCGVNMFLLRKGPDGWKIFQIAATSRTEGCRAIVK
jgi:hypothetical protein